MARFNPAITDTEAGLLPKGTCVRLQTWRARVQLLWKTPLDVDLHAYYRIKASPAGGAGWLAKWLGGADAAAPEVPPEWRTRRDGHVYYADMGSAEHFPWVALDQDAGVGDLPGYNEENLILGDLRVLEQVLVVANIFNKPAASFADFDGELRVHCDGQVYALSLDTPEPGSYCCAAHLDLSGRHAVLTNVCRTQMHEPSLDAFLASRLF